MSDHLVLLFAYHFPPDPSAGSTRPYHFAKYLARLGYEVAVFTAAAERAPGPFEVHCIEDPLVRGHRRGPGWQMERACRKLFWPGAAGLRWAVRAVEAARQVRDRSRARRQTVLSTFPPLGAHLAAWWLAKQTGLPWVADFRDPMAFIPGVWPQMNPIHRRAAVWLERRWVYRAAAVVANTEAAAEQLRARHADRASRVYRIWNGFDPEEWVGPLPLPPRPYRLYSHVGELYAGRSAKGLLDSIGRLVDRGRLDPQQFRILLAGPVEEGTLPDPAFVQRALRLGWLELRPELVPRQEALRIAQTSDGLILIQPHSEVQVPSKLFEYLQIGRPVLAYVPAGSQTEAVLLRSGVPFVCAYAGLNEEDLDHAVLSYFSLPPESVAPNASFEMEFSAERRTRRLAEILEALQTG